jgi:hypothetical protein
VRVDAKHPLGDEQVVAKFDVPTAGATIDLARPALIGTQRAAYPRGVEPANGPLRRDAEEPAALLSLREAFS